MARLALKLFGSYRLELDGHNIDALETDKARALLAYLAVEGEHPHAREKLVGLFWPEQDEEHARGSLSQALYQLRGVLGDRPLPIELPPKTRAQIREPYLLVIPQAIQLNPHSDIETDVAAFLALVKTCKAHSHPLYKLCDDCLKRYQEASRLYTGDFLDGFYVPKSLAFEEWATILREQLRLEAMAALEQLVTVFEGQGELDQALGYARRMVKLDELGEAGNLHVMRLLALMDKRVEAHAQYASFHHALAVQMGAEPGIETKTLYQHLRNEEAGTDVGNLPASLAPLIGRKRELEELWVMLRDPKQRLICVLGPGGSGKTRLALEAGQRQRYYFRDGVYFVPLSSLGPGSSLLAAIAEGLGFTFRELGLPKKQLLDYLRNKKILLFLDSFETVEESAGLVAEILSASEGSNVLVTSRVRLNVSGEFIFPLEGMQVPPRGAEEQALSYSAAELFLEAARRVRPGYSPESLDDVAHICRLVEGMPLSLLLASTWVSDYSAREIADQISRSLDFLSVEWADLPVRQRSLRATFEYSWNLLSPREQEVLMGLAVFRNPFSTQAAYQVAGANPQLLHALVGKSLLGSTAEGQYQMHDLVHQYSAEKLDLASGSQVLSAHQKHCDYFLEQSAGWSKIFKGPQQSVLLAQADKEIDDVQSAWEWAAQQADLDRLWRASEGLLMFYILRYRYQEGEHACLVAIEAVMSAPMGGELLNLEGCLLVWRASFCRLLGKIDLARNLLNASLESLSQAEAAGQDVRQGQALHLRESEYFVPSLQEKLDYLQKSATLYQALGDPWSQAGALRWAGEYANRLGNYELALNLHQQAEMMSRLAGDPRRLAEVVRFLGYDYLIHGPWETGARLMEDAAEIYRRLGDLGSQAQAELHLGVTLGWIGRRAEACESLELALVKMRQLGDRFYIAYCTLGLGIVQMHSGEYERAAKSLQNGLVAAQQDGFQREEAGSLLQIGCLALVRGDPLGALVDIQTSVSNLRKMGFAGELSMALGGLALAQHRLGQEQQAWASLLEALRIAVETHSRFTLITLPAPVVVMLADAGRWDQAVEAYTAVITDPLVANSRWFADMVGNRMDITREHLDEAACKAAEVRGREGVVFDVLGRLAQEIEVWSISQPNSSLN